MEKKDQKRNNGRPISPSRKGPISSQKDQIFSQRARSIAVAESKPMNNVFRLHSRLIKTGRHHDPPSLRRILLSCVVAAPESLPYARSIFLRFPSPDTFVYNTIIRAHARFSPSLALSFFASMRRSGISLDHFTFPFVLTAASRLLMGFHLHSLIHKLGFGSDIFIQNALINSYGCCGSVEPALKVFEEMRERDLVSWSSVIASLVNNGFAYEALSVFRQMQLEQDLNPDEITMLSSISAVSILGALELGRWIEMFIRKRGLEITVSLGTALIDMFSRCGAIAESIRVFDEMPQRNVLTWTALINGLAVHGLGREAVMAFYRMRNCGLHPDYITFSAILVACSHGGLIEDGRHIFESMKSVYQIEPLLEHYGCMVDLFGRAGLLHEAYEFVERMPLQPNSVIWRTLLGACVTHKNIKVAEIVKAKIDELDPYHEGDYVLLSNAYGGVGKWAEKAMVRRSMKEKKISKKAGCSFVNIDQEIHEFVSGDNSHPQFEEIAKFLGSIIGDLRNGGYATQTSNVLHDIEGEEKEHSLGFHSEKLAVAFALLSVNHKWCIRIMKNLRICDDCHSFLKHVSNKFGREIIVRDRVRFHHFKNGSCSCKDYW